MTLAYTSFRPQTSIIIHSWRGGTFDLTGDLINWQTQKALTQPQGTFSVGLVDRKHGGKSWDELVWPMDYIEIRASKNGEMIDGELPIIMRGFVDYSGKNASFSARGGPAEPRISIMGRDYSKLLIEWQILYLYTMNNESSMAQAQMGLGLDSNYGLPQGPTPLPKLMQAFFDKLAAPTAKGLQIYNNAIPDFLSVINLPDYESSLVPVLAYTGSYWNLFSYYSSPPFGELFVRDDDDGPTLHCRVAPYKTLAGDVPSPGTHIPTTITLSTDEMQMYDAGYSDNDVLTYYLTWGDSTQMVQMTMPVFVTDPNNGVNIGGQNLYGTRPFIVDSSWVNAFNGDKLAKKSPYAIQNAADLNKWLVAVNEENQYFKSATFSMAGSEAYRIGNYAEVPQWDEEYYISVVSHQFTMYQQWTTQLQAVRGRSLSTPRTTDFLHGVRVMS